MIEMKSDDWAEKLSGYARMDKGLTDDIIDYIDTVLPDSSIDDKVILFHLIFNFTKEKLEV